MGARAKKAESLVDQLNALSKPAAGGAAQAPSDDKFDELLQTDKLGDLHMYYDEDKIAEYQKLRRVDQDSSDSQIAAQTEVVTAVGADAPSSPPTQGRSRRAESDAGPHKFNITQGRERNVSEPPRRCPSAKKQLTPPPSPLAATHPNEWFALSGQVIDIRRRLAS